MQNSYLYDIHLFSNIPFPADIVTRREHLLVSKSIISHNSVCCSCQFSLKLSQAQKEQKVVSLSTRIICVHFLKAELSGFEMNC